MIHGRQQQTAMPMTHARATQKMIKNTSNARKTMQSLKKQKKQIKQEKISNKKDLHGKPIIQRYIFRE